MKSGNEDMINMLTCPFREHLYIPTGSPAMINTTTINITLTDENDNQPIFSGAPYLVTIPEGTRGPQVVLTVVATDEDSSTNGQIEYFTAGGTVGDFRIDTNTVSILEACPCRVPLALKYSILKHVWHAYM